MSVLFDGVMESVTSLVVGAETVYSSCLQGVEDSIDDLLLMYRIGRVNRQNVHKVLALIVLFLDNSIICSLLDQREE